eukprot:9650822-Alexandrium_andersonii.AAC.1
MAFLERAILASVARVVWGRAAEYRLGTGLQTCPDFRAMTTVLTGGIWIKTRSHEAGYSVGDTKCMFCQQQDIEMHRFWQCLAGMQCLWLRGISTPSCQVPEAPEAPIVTLGGAVGVECGVRAPHVFSAGSGTTNSPATR